MNKAILVSIIAVIALLTLTFVSADTGEFTDDWYVQVDGTPADGSILGIEAGETIPIKVVFTALECAEDVTVEAEINGYRVDIEDETDRFDILEESRYTKRLTLNLPADTELAEDYTLTITISNKDKKDDMEYTIRIQRESYRLDVLDAELPIEAQAGNVVAVDVILKNYGMRTLEDIFAKVSIPELGVTQKVYFGDIDPMDECEDSGLYDICEDDDNHDYCRYYFKDCDMEDAAERRVYITIPTSASSGMYEVEIEAYNVDSSTVIKKSISISGKEEATSVLTGSTSKTLNVGEEVTYDLVIVNSGTDMKVYTLTPEQTNGLIVDVDPVVTVPADSSRTVRVSVKATESAEEGTHLIKINVESDGELVQQASLSANVEKGAVQVANSIVVLTIVLVIVFIVLLIILIVLLTKRPAQMETEETSYY